MAISVLEAFVCTFGIDSSGFKRGEQEVTDGSKRLKEQVRKDFSGMEEGASKLSVGLRGVGREMLGLFLLSQGASSLTNLFTGMVHGAAGADRLSQSLGTSTDKVLAWQQAMKEINASPSDADSALGTMAGLKQDWMHFGLQGDQRSLILGRMGLTSADLENSDPSDLLIKLAKAKRPYGDAEYAWNLQQLGLSQGMINRMVQDGPGLEAKIRELQAKSKGLAAEADKAKSLEENLATLSFTIQRKLVPVMDRLVTVLNRILSLMPGGHGEGSNASREDAIRGVMGKGILGKVWNAGLDIWGGALTGGKSPPMPKTGVGWGVFGAVTAVSNALNAGAAGSDPIMAYLISHGVSPAHALGIRAGIAGEGGAVDAVNPNSGAFGIGQWLGPRKAELFRRYGDSPNFNQQMEFLLWELRGGDKISNGSVLRAMDTKSAMWQYFYSFMRPQGKNNEHWKDLMGDWARGLGFLSKNAALERQINNYYVTINADHVNGKQLAKDFTGELKKRNVAAQADRGVAP